jgi:hypothetical protein
VKILNPAFKQILKARRYYDTLFFGYLVRPAETPLVEYAVIREMLQRMQDLIKLLGTFIPESIEGEVQTPPQPPNEPEEKSE